MLNIPQLLLEMSGAVRDDAISDPDRLADMLQLDLSSATVTMTKVGTFAIVGARKEEDGSVIGVVSVLKPAKVLYLIFTSRAEPFVAAQFSGIGSDPKRVESKYASGFTLLLSVNGVTCGVTVSSDDGTIGSLSCEAPVAP